MDIRVGKITHYFDRIGVAVLELYEELNVGETIHVHGRTTDFRQRIVSMEIEHEKIQVARPKDEVALKMLEPVHEGDIIYRVVEEQ